ncbi:MAG: STAS domain-containing protein [Rhodoferax sp.]|nr:STAS domain-containing protein [Rhodoferax sp.]HQZ07929.1 STAS domain-containing protein [Burkholderiaceae bacterium]
MSAKDNNPSLLSKVAKFVRNPTTNWTDLDKQDPEPEAGYSKQALKEMIERKRQNDFVRKREFDQLRKLRSRDPASSPDLAGRPSYFQSSMPSNSDERAMTIKKIDEIEAQMSNQWWQGKNSGVPAPGAAPAAARPGDSGESQAPAQAESDPSYAPTRLSPMRPETAVADAEASDFPTTQSHSGFGPSTGPTELPVSQSPVEDSARAAPASGLGRGFMHSRPAPVEWVEGMSDPDLEEAAIRFANGDEGGAEASLQTALSNPDAKPDRAVRWAMALLDLYRATGQQGHFDIASIEFAERFNRSAPPWFSIPANLGLKNASALVRTLPSRLSAEPLWRSPEQFGAGSVDDLRLAVANAVPPWFIDWEPITRVEPGATDAMAVLFDEWCSTPVNLHFSGVKALESALRRCAPSGDRSVSPSGWKLRLNALRIMGMRDEFELVALDYCVTFEVSPPTWQDVRCQFTQVGAADTDAGPADTDRSGLDARSDGPGFAQAPTLYMGVESTQAAVSELSGEVLGDAAEALARMETERKGAQRLVVSCANLVRVDFSAAGSILNWAANLQGEGCQVQFLDLHRLVAAFFGVVGIHDHARVVMRAN